MKVVEFLEFGWPIGYSRPASSLKNHKGTQHYAAGVDKYWVKEVGYGAIWGHFCSNP